MTLRISNLEARDLNEAWFKCIREVCTYGREYEITSGSYTGQKRKQLDYITCHIINPGTRPLVPTVPEGIPAPSSIEYIEKDYLPYLMTSAIAPNETYTYGQYVEPQFLKVIEMYKKHGYGTNQATIAICDANSIDCSDPPCLRQIDTRIIDDKLHFFIYFRSWDLYTGFPSNLAGIQMMKEMMADEIGVSDGEMVIFSKGLHLYEYQWAIAKQIVGME